MRSFCQGALRGGDPTRLARVNTGVLNHGLNPCAASAPAYPTPPRHATPPSAAKEKEASSVARDSRRRFSGKCPCRDLDL